MNYTHLSQKERDQIYDLLQEGQNRTAISIQLGRDKSTIVREIKRNSLVIERRLNNSPSKKKHYLPGRAQIKYETRRKQAKYAFPLKDPFTHRYVTRKLKTGESPETIAGRLKLKYNFQICHETIYLYIYSNRARNLKLWKYLRRSHRKRRKWHGRKAKHTLIPNRVDITKRPKEVETRLEFGHWEGDTIVGIGKKSALNTEVERLSRYVFIRKVKRKTAIETSNVMINIFKLLPDQAKKTCTLDNGSEFTGHERITVETRIKFFFALPYHSWERGTNENTNGLIRWYFPKKTDFDMISDEEIQKVQDTLNNRPRKCLGFYTPNEVFHHHLSKCCT